MKPNSAFVVFVLVVTSIDRPLDFHEITALNAHIALLTQDATTYWIVSNDPNTQAIREVFSR